jgi:hypothetical protein
MAVGAPVPVALLIGAAWGVVILNLDRMLIVGMGQETSLGRNFAMAAPRLEGLDGAAVMIESTVWLLGRVLVGFGSGRVSGCRVRLVGEVVEGGLVCAGCGA